MKKVQFGKKKISAKVFYSAAVVCLVAIGAATYVSVDRSLSDLQNETTSRIEASAPSVDDTGVGKQVNEPVSDIPVESSPPEEKREPIASGAFIMPINGEIIQGFSNGQLIKSQTLSDWRTHDGIDILAEAATPVKAIGDGKVTEVREDAMWGVCVVIDHYNGYVGYYYGLSENLNVKQDAEVKIGDTIGSVGPIAAESALESHLHFGIKNLGNWIDPVSVIPQD